eukprot:8938390-Pyramimonas_sp.AAC.1
MRISDLSAPGAPCHFTRGTQWENIPSILSIGVPCRAKDTGKTRGRQFAHGCPCRPGDNRIQSGLRVDSEVFVMASLKNLLRDNIPILRSAHDIAMSASRDGRIPPTHVVQLI